jgi:hypothetical protein
LTPDDKCKKSLKRKVLIILFGHLCYRYQQHQRYWWENLLTGAVAPDLRISSQIFKKLGMILMIFSGGWGKMVHEKTCSKKSSDTVLLKYQICIILSLSLSLSVVSVTWILTCSDLHLPPLKVEV